MTANRLFIPQHVLDLWLSEDRVEVQGEILVTKPEGVRLALTTAVRFKAEVAGGADEAKLVGRVKDLAQIGELGAEHYADSVIHGESAYEVVEGFTATLLPAEEGGGGGPGPDDDLGRLVGGR
ncbi:MAG: hypothetical protein ACFCGT_03035 [Sandaracinaceae bacterium]